MTNSFEDSIANVISSILWLLSQGINSTLNSFCNSSAKQMTLFGQVFNCTDMGGFTKRLR